MSRPLATEPYVRLASRVLAALTRGDLTCSRFGLLVHLVGELDLAEELTLTLAQLRDGCGWEASDETLRRALHELTEQKWIKAEVAMGGRRWSIRLVDARLEHEQPDEPPHDLHMATPSHVEVRSTRTPFQTSTRDVAVTGANQHRDSKRGASKPPHDLPAEPPHAARGSSSSFSEGEYDHLVGETTSDADDDEIPFLLRGEVDPRHSPGAYRDGRTVCEVCDGSEFHTGGRCKRCGS